MKKPQIIYRVSELKKVSEMAARVAGMEKRSIPSTIHSYCSTEVFHKISRHLDSAVLLSPSRQPCVVDVSALAALARVVIESREALIYFTQRGVPAEEREFRVKLFEFHSSFETMEIYSRFGLDASYELFGMSEVLFRSIERDLRTDAYFSALTNKEQKMLLSGRKAYYWRGNKPVCSFMSTDTESALFKLLSNHVHSLPLGASSRYGVSGLVGELNTAFFAIEALLVYSASAIQEFCAFRWKLGRCLSDEEKEYLKKLLQERKLEAWLKQMRENEQRYS